MWYIWTSNHFNAQSFWWVKAFKAGKFSVEDDTRPGRPKTSVTKANIAALKIVVVQDARLSFKDIASCTGISEGSVHTVLKKRIDLRKVCARWVPYSPDLSPCDFFLFPRLKKMHSGNKYTSRSALGSVIYQCL